jgi:hypothetical protein
MEGLKDKRSVAEIYREHQISQTLYYRWRDKFLEGVKRGLVHGGSDHNAYTPEIEKLQRIIEKQAIQIQIPKKRGSYSGEDRGGEGSERFGLHGEGCLSGPWNVEKRILTPRNVLTEGSQYKT